jgi:DNA-binding MarR family transcriptional regulator
MARGSIAYPSPDGSTVSAIAVDDAVLTASSLLVAVSARSIESVDESITLARFRLLVMLGTRGPLNLSVLADHLGVTPATVTRTITRLAAAGLVHKRPNPRYRREVVIGLTAAGAAVVARVTERRHEEIARIVARMPEEAQRDLVTALEAFNAAGGRTCTDEPMYPGEDEI